MSNKWTLDTDSMQENFFSGAALIGITTSLSHYRLCWLLNNYFDINFMRDPELDVSILSPGGEKIFFPVYQYILPLGGGRYTIYKLKKGEDLLLPEVRQLDYIWLIHSSDSEYDASVFINELRNMQEIQLAQAIFPEKLKNADFLFI